MTWLWCCGFQRSAGSDDAGSRLHGDMAGTLIGAQVEVWGRTRRSEGVCAVCLTSSCLFVRDAGVKRQVVPLIHDAIGQPSSRIHGHVLEGHPGVCEGVGSDDSMIQQQYPAAP